jgi:bifunctional UDP-N-acetylglucosamine pyrophosphorylase / glucosamine-1-phosphate N-acetyltransferase
MSLQVIILAAGQGKRMYSTLAKVLHLVGGKPMISHVVDVAMQLNADAIHVVYGHEAEQVKKIMANYTINWVWQEEQLGTGHAVMQVLPFLPQKSQVMILSADVPLITADSLAPLLDYPESLNLLLAQVENPHGLGRILRDDDNNIQGIVEERDATLEQKKINEIYSGILSAPNAALTNWLPQLGNDNAQNEYYLTEIIGMAVKQGMSVRGGHVNNPMEVAGVNNRLQLENCERAYQKRLCQRLMNEGVGMMDASRVDIRGELLCEQDVVIDVNTIFEGVVSLAKGVSIGPNCVLKDVTIGAKTMVHANSVLEGAAIGDNCQIGPFARIRPQTVLESNCKVGNFVEMKKATLGYNSKVSHLSYIGDANIGREVNIGAGTITCNYDGENKYQTIIEDEVFIGSDSQLVAPVTIGKGATIGAGSTIRRNAPSGELTLTEQKQKTITGWKRKTKT